MSLNLPIIPYSFVTSNNLLDVYSKNTYSNNNPLSHHENSGYNIKLPKCPQANIMGLFVLNKPSLVSNQFGELPIC